MIEALLHRFELGWLPRRLERIELAEPWAPGTSPGVTLIVVAHRGAHRLHAALDVTAGAEGTSWMRITLVIVLLRPSSKVMSIVTSVSLAPP